MTAQPDGAAFMTLLKIALGRCGVPAKPVTISCDDDMRSRSTAMSSGGVLAGDNATH